MRRAVFILAALVVTAPGARAQGAQPNESDLFRALGTAVYASSAADLLTSELGMALGHEEANPLMRNRGVRIVSKVAFPFLFNKLTAHLYPKSPKTAIAMRLAATVGFTYLATRNLEICITVRLP